MAKGITNARIASTVILLCLGAAAAAPMAAAAAPYTGVPAPVPGTIEAETFDLGGEGVGYHDNTWGNDFGSLRVNESVDIRADPRAPYDNWIIGNIETGEWLAYSIDVAQSGMYDWGVLGATPYNGASFHFEIDGWNLTGRVNVPNTGDWNAFRWAGAQSVWLNKGRYVLKVVSEGQYFDLDSIVLVPSAGSAPAAPRVSALQTSLANFACAFNAVRDCGFIEQGEAPGRASLTSISRDGGTALRLHTEPGDTYIAGSGTMERDDVYLAKPGTADPDTYGEGVEQWWAHSILFPNDFAVPTSYQGYVVFDFHNTGSAAQANFHVGFEPWNDPAHPGLLRIFGYGGDPWSASGRYDAVIGQVQKNVWYDFVYHVRWSSGPDGFIEAWVNGKQVISRRGPTLYWGQSVYMKLANYHAPVCEPWPACVGNDQPSSVIHDRVVRGTTPQAVALGPLEGALDLINGVLTPRY